MKLKSALVFFLGALAPLSVAGALGQDDPIIPAIKIEPASDTAGAGNKLLAQSDALFAELSKANSELASLHAKVVEKTVELRKYSHVTADPGADAELKKAAQTALEKLNRETKPLSDEYTKASNQLVKLCLKQFEQQAFHLVDGAEKTSIERAGFSCVQGERMVADTTPREIVNCGMQVTKVRGDFGYVPGGAGGGGIAGGPGMVPEGHGHGGLSGGGGGFHGFSGCGGSLMPSRPVGRAACINGQDKVTASAGLVATEYKGKTTFWTANNTRFHFDGQNRVKGWTASGPGVVVETELKGDAVVKRTLQKDKEIARCEWKVDVDFEKYFSQGGQLEPRIKPSDMVK